MSTAFWATITVLGVIAIFAVMGSFTLSERSIVRFGAGNNWVYKAFDAGTYTASNSTFGGDPYHGVTKGAEVVSDFSVEQGSNKTHIGFYTDFTQATQTAQSSQALQAAQTQTTQEAK